MKGYTFYDSTLSGSNLALTTLKVRQPIFREKSFPVGPFIFQNMSFGFIGQVGGGFSGKIENWTNDELEGQKAPPCKNGGGNKEELKSEEVPLGDPVRRRKFLKTVTPWKRV